MINTLTKTTMGLLVLATTPVGGDPTMWAQWGLAGIVVGYALFRDWHRERRMSDAIDKHQTWVRETLIQALNRNTVALEKLTMRSNAIETLRTIHGSDH